MLFDEKFIKSIKNEPTTSILEAINLCYNTLSPPADPLSINTNTDEDYSCLLETYYLISSIIDTYNLTTSISNKITICGELQNDCNNILENLGSIQDSFIRKSNILKAESFKSKFQMELNNVFAYEFSQGDIDRIQVLINELREEIKKSNLFQSEHQERLLKRLEKLQSEMHKKMANIDRFWGLIGDAGVVLGKFGKDSKPLVDRIREISDIVWRTQSRAEELPSSTPPPTKIEAEIIDEEL